MTTEKLITMIKSIHPNKTDNYNQIDGFVEARNKMLEFVEQDEIKEEIENETRCRNDRIGSMVLSR